MKPAPGRCVSITFITIFSRSPNCKRVDKKYVSVTVGVSSKYMAAAAKMRTETAKNIAKGREAEANRNNSSHFESDNGQNPTTSQPSTEQVDSGRTHRRSPAFNDF